MDLRDLIPQNEKDLISDYIHFYGADDDSCASRQCREFAGVDNVLSMWNESKGRLFKLFGEKLILTKEIKITVDEEVLKEEMVRMTNEKGRTFYEEFWHWFHYNKDIDVDWTYDENGFKVYRNNWTSFDRDTLYSLMTNIIYHPDQNEVYIHRDLWSEEVGQKTCCKVPTPSGKTIDIFSNSKPMKILGKIAAAYNLEGFEDFRIAHSQVLNTKELSGELCLSIHPLDYMTMSDNDCGWESCMSWTNRGGYRSGTVEILNSSCVVIAYLKSKKPYYISSKGSWNNKKWRSMFIVDDHFLCKIKSYPYQKKEFEVECLNWLNELSTKNFDYPYDNENIICWDGDHSIYYQGENDKYEKSYYIYPETDQMYNDFGSTDHYFMPHKSMSDLYEDGREGRYTVNYSGYPTCMWCGKETYIDEDAVVCENCFTRRRCTACGETIYGEGNTYYDAYGNEYCEYCFDNRCFEDEVSHEYYDDNYKEYIFVIPGADRIKRVVEKFQEKEAFQRINLKQALRWIDTPAIEVNVDFMTLRARSISKTGTAEALRMFEEPGRWCSNITYYIDPEDLSEEYAEGWGIPRGEEDMIIRELLHYYERNAYHSEAVITACEELMNEFFPEDN